MSISTVLFDLDGTLLPLEQELFVQDYFKRLAAKIAPLGYEPGQLIKTIWSGINAMKEGDGSQTNEQLFWDFFCRQYGPGAKEHEPHFRAFYETEFQEVRSVCGFSPMAKEVVALCKQRGRRVVLATNPLFPAVATESRIRWAGLMPENFDLYTTYENSSYCKPDLRYYQEILTKLHIRPEECLMVGNDVEEDMVAAKLGMKVFLLTDHLINEHGTDLSAYPHGDFNALIGFLQENL